jgi:hypothetical protein
LFFFDMRVQPNLHSISPQDAVIYIDKIAWCPARIYL